MFVSVRCPADGVVGVTAVDLRTVVVRSGSDVELTYSCPLCGSPIVVCASVDPGLTAMIRPCERGERIAFAGPPRRRMTHPGGSSPLRRRDDFPRLEAYAEYFRRELARADTVDAMLAEMDTSRR